MAVALVAFFVAIRGLPVNQGFEAAIAWVEGLGPLAPLAFVLIYFLATVLLLPAWPLSVAAGAVFGLFMGSAVVIAGATSGAAGAFILTRYLARNTVELRLKNYPRFAAVDRAVGEGGWKIVFLLRLSPAFPFSLQNYAYGLTAIRFWPCVLATAAGIVPGVFMYVYFGVAGRAGLEATGGEVDGGWAQTALLVAGLIATIIVTVYITRLARKAIKQHSELEPQEDETVTTPPAERTATSWKPALISTAVAAAMVIVAGCVHNPPTFLVRLFGPPSVAMADVYADVDGDASFDHGPFDAILKAYVNESGGVDYAGLKESPDALLAYNESLADAPFDAMGRDERLALLINAYNSFTLQLIIEYLDDDFGSIRDIPKAKSWDDTRWVIGEHTWSLNQIEHEQIRPNFLEPDIHWVLVCAAVGCPPLRREAYAAHRVEEQLRDQARIVHTDGTRWLQHDPDRNRLNLTRLYQWYGGDFEQVAGSVEAYVGRYFQPMAEALEAGNPPSIDWLEYDWSLNNQENLP